MNLKDADEILKKLRKTRIDHREFIRARDELFTLSALAPAGSVIALVGPTRAGKSRIRKYLQKCLVDPSLTDGSIPLIYTDAANTDLGRFSTKHLTLRLLEEVKHPIYAPSILNSDNKRTPNETISRFALEEAMKGRSVRFTIIDESQHIGIVRSVQRAGDIVDSLKTLASTTGTVLILIGGYLLLRALYESAHLNGRMTIVHFPRYRDTKEDNEEFDKSVSALDNILPLPKGKSLIDPEYRTIIRPGTLGVFGQSVEWIDIALRNAAASKSRFLLPEHFARTRTTQQIESIAKEIAFGEKNMTPSGEIVLENEKKSVKPKNQKKRSSARKKPFTRNPIRDRVGVDSRTVS